MGLIVVLFKKRKFEKTRQDSNSTYSFKNNSEPCSSFSLGSLQLQCLFKHGGTQRDGLCGAPGGGALRFSRTHGRDTCRGKPTTLNPPTFPDDTADLQEAFRW